LPVKRELFDAEIEQLRRRKLMSFKLDGLRERLKLDGKI